VQTWLLSFFLFAFLIVGAFEWTLASFPIFSMLIPPSPLRTLAQWLSTFGIAFIIAFVYGYKTDKQQEEKLSQYVPFKPVEKSVNEYAILLETQKNR